MTYTPKQQEYIDSVGGAAHMSAVEIIGELEKQIEMMRDRGKCTCKGDSASMCKSYYLIGNCVYKG